MNKKQLLFVYLISAAVLSGQEPSAFIGQARIPQAPVVSEISARVDNSTVMLSWNPAPAETSAYEIYRSEVPVTASTFPSSTYIARVNSSTVTYADAIESGKTFFYAVLARSPDDTLYEFFIPSSNSLLVGVSAGDKPLPRLPVVFNGFDLLVRNDAVIITWSGNSRDKNLVLYRSTSPFTDLNSLVPAVVISSFTDTGTPFVDYPVPGIPYYYAIIDEDSVRSGKVSFVPAKNTNRIPVEISPLFSRIQRSKLPSLRPMPLPWLNPSQTVPEDTTVFGKRTESIISVLVSGQPPIRRTMPVPYILDDDKTEKAVGEDYSLRQILDKNFPEKKWEGAQKELIEFISLRRTPKTTARTRFYLGQVYFFRGDYKNALLEFLLAQDYYYSKSREWIQYVLNAL